MPGSLYLDTARLGRMTPSAHDANLDFVRLTAEEPSSLYFEKFLRDGRDAWPAQYRERFPGLGCWGGPAELKRSLAQLAGTCDSRRVLLASRSAQLMMLAARLLFRTCRKVLATDMSWPAYRTILETEASRTGNSLATVPVRRLILNDGITADELTTLLAAEFVGRECDGLFVPAIDNLGIRLPVEGLVRDISRGAEVRFVVVDGAQAFSHIPIRSCLQKCDFFIAGCHKWLRAYHPMGVAFCGQNAFHNHIVRTVDAMLESFGLDDPLLRFTQQLESKRLDGYSETVNLTPLFSCAGAICDVPKSEHERDESFHNRKANAELLCDAAESTDWCPIRPSGDLQTGILLMQTQRPDTRRTDPDELRASFQDCGIVLSAYDEGLIRLSMPEQPLEAPAVERVRESLVQVNQGPVKRIPSCAMVP